MTTPRRAPAAGAAPAAEPEPCTPVTAAMSNSTGQIVPMDEATCYARLADASVGRVAVTMGAVPAVLPVTFCLVDGRIVFRTGSGGPLLDATDGRVVAFEIDDLPVGPAIGDGPGWWVQVVGWARRVTDDGLQAKACAALPWGWQHDGVDVVVAVEPRMVSGRQMVLAEAD